MHRFYKYRHIISYFNGDKMTAHVLPLDMPLLLRVECIKQEKQARSERLCYRLM